MEAILLFINTSKYARALQREKKIPLSANEKRILHVYLVFPFYKICIYNLFVMTMTSISIKIQPCYFFSHGKLQKLYTHKFIVASIFIIVSVC
jgi:hypothetical protein